VELRQYRHVLALADHAGFRKASEALGISQPALTKSLFQIDREVGQRLFERHGQTISPTVFGAIVVDTARKEAEGPRGPAADLALPERDVAEARGHSPQHPGQARDLLRVAEVAGVAAVHGGRVRISGGRPVG
jgi:LysR family cyn operon transcriptional activator